MTNKRPGIAVIGSGYWGKNLVRNYHELGALKLICDKNEAVLADFAEHYPDVQACIALNHVLSSEDIDGVVIATPAETHYALAREALLSGRHVYVEKPLVLDHAIGPTMIVWYVSTSRIAAVSFLASLFQSEGVSLTWFFMLGSLSSS